ncbi:MAG TPA: electron transfer flavoprotein subunit beta [Propionicimonas sp.]
MSVVVPASTTGGPRIVVLVKYVPDAEAGSTFTDDRLVDRDGPGLLSELDEYPLGAARRLADTHGGEVVALAVGPAAAAHAVTRALQLGADRGVLVSDDALEGSDAHVTARVLARAVRLLEPVDLVLAGARSPDGGTSLVPSLLALDLGVPAHTFVLDVVLDEGSVRTVSPRDGRVLTTTSGVPAVVSVTDQAPAPQYPTFADIRRARTRPTTVLRAADLGLRADEVGRQGSRTEVLAVTPRAAREPGSVVVDDGHAGERLATFLLEHTR